MLFSGASGGSGAAFHVSGYSRPGLLALKDGSLLAVWAADVNGRSGINRPSLCYSVYSVPNSSWSAPALVWDDGTNDSSPSLWQVGEEVYVTWQNHYEALNSWSADQTDAYTVLAENTVIAAARWNGSGFEDAQNILNSTDGTDPQMGLKGGEAAVAWQTVLQSGGAAEPEVITWCSSLSAGGGSFSAALADGTLHILANEVTFAADGSCQNADLKLYERTLGASVSVGEVDYICKTLVPGETVTLTAYVTNDGFSTVESLDVQAGGGTGGASVYAALYDANGRMTAVAAGSHSGSTVTFTRDLSAGWTLFFMNPETRAPLCEKITLK